MYVKHSIPYFISLLYSKFVISFFFIHRYFADTLAHNENGGGTTTHGGRVEAATAQQPPSRLPSPITQSHPVSSTCTSATTTVPNGAAYKDPQSYVHP